MMVALIRTASSVTMPVAALARVGRDFNTYNTQAVRPGIGNTPATCIPRSSSHPKLIDRGRAMSGQTYWLSWERAAKTGDEAIAIVDRYRRCPHEEFHPVANDVQEQRNLAAGPEIAERVRATRALLDTLLDETRDPQACSAIRSCWNLC